MVVKVVQTVWYFGVNCGPNQTLNMYLHISLKLTVVAELLTTSVFQIKSVFLSIILLHKQISKELLSRSREKYHKLLLLITKT